MDRLPHQQLFRAGPRPDRGFALVERDRWSNPSSARPSPEAPALPDPTRDIRGGVYLRWHNVTSSATILYRAPRFQVDRRVVSILGLVVVAYALFVGLSRYDFSPSIQTVAGTTYNSAVTGLTSAVNAARDLISKGPEGPAPTATVASIPKRKAPSSKPAAEKRGPINSARPLQLLPLISPETVRANGPAPIGNAGVTATLETSSREAPALPADSAVETSTIYSPTDTDVSPPVAIRSPGIARDRSNGDKDISFVEILVNETGQVESAKGRQRPATLGAALQSTTALSVVKTWLFQPARKNGQSVKYRTTVPFIETFNPAGTTDARR
jgi:hypothetical protein